MNDTTNKTNSPLVSEDIQASLVSIPVSLGELFDKITILEIKLSKITNSMKLINIEQELHYLKMVRQDAVSSSPALDNHVQALKSVNLKLWQIEDDIREKESLQQFDGDFINLARSVYQQNDKRADLKREISLLLGSAIMEEKSYHSTEHPA